MPGADRTPTLLLLTLLGCGTPEPAPPGSVDLPPLQSAPTTTPNSAGDAPRDAALPSCCKDGDEIRKLDGRRVVIEGTYARTAIYKRQSNDPEKARELDRKARTVSIQMGTASLMLEIYYSDKGKRDESELERFDGKRVRVIGRVQARTPDQMHGDIPMATMTNPSIVDIESIELAN